MNPFLKTALTVIGGALLPALDQIVSNVVPTGGFAHTLQSSPVLATLFGTSLFAAHNFLTTLEGRWGIHPAQGGQ